MGAPGQDRLSTARGIYHGAPPQARACQDPRRWTWSGSSTRSGRTSSRAGRGGCSRGFALLAWGSTRSTADLDLVWGAGMKSIAVTAEQLRAIPSAEKLPHFTLDV